MKKLVLLIFVMCLFAEDRTSNAIIEEVKKAVENKFLMYYKSYNIKINHLDVAPVMDRNLNNFHIDKVIFDDRDLRKDSGNFEVYLTHNEKKKKVFFSFNINATIDALVATSSIKTGEVLTHNNTTLSQVSIAKNMTLPSSEDVLDKYSAKSFIPAGTSIVNAKITPKTIVSKGDVIEISYQINGISLTFHAKALEDASIGQSIKAQNTQSGKNINVIILGPKSAKINE